MNEIIHVTGPVITPASLDRVEARVAQLLSERAAHLRDLFAERDRHFAHEFMSQKEAVDKAERATDRRFESVNEFRKQMGDMQSTLMPRAEAEARIANLLDKILMLEATNAQNAARSRGSRELWAIIVGVLMVVLAIASFLTNR